MAAEESKPSEKLPGIHSHYARGDVAEKVFILAGVTVAGVPSVHRGLTAADVCGEDVTYSLGFALKCVSWGGRRLAQSVERVIIDLGVVGSSLTLGVEIT